MLPPLGLLVSASEAAIAGLSPPRARPSMQSSALDESGHRPWPAPARPWFMAQTWDRLLFMHWQVPLDDLRRVMPPQLEPDAFDGSGWLGVTPFRVSGMRLRGTLPLPGVSSFPEVNVRTYVTIDGRPGIFFMSLDAARDLAVQSARRLYRIPYWPARMRIEEDADGGQRFHSARRGGAPEAELDVRYRATGPPSPAAPGSLEWFLTERYCLYTLDGRGRVLIGEIHHRPWTLQPASAEVRHNTMARPYGIELNEPPLLHYGGRQDVVFWRLAPA